MMGEAIGRSLTMGWSGENCGKGSPSLATAREPDSHVDIISLPTAAAAASCEEDGRRVLEAPSLQPDKVPGAGRSSPVWFSVAASREAWLGRSCDPRDRLRWCDEDCGTRRDPWEEGMSLRGGLGVTGLEDEAAEEFAV